MQAKVHSGRVQKHVAPPQCPIPIFQPLLFQKCLLYSSHTLYIHALAPSFQFQENKNIVCTDKKRNFQKKKWLTVLQISPYLTQFCPKIHLLVTKHHMFQDFSSGPLPQYVLEMVSKQVCRETALITCKKLPELNNHNNKSRKELPK